MEAPEWLDLDASGVNVNDSERWLSVIGGGMLALAGISRKSTRGALVALAGGALIARGLTGHCTAYSALDVDTLSSGEDDEDWDDLDDDLYDDPELYGDADDEPLSDEAADPTVTAESLGPEEW